MADFIYLIHPFRKEFFRSPTQEENDIMDEHYLYLRKATEEGKVILAGPCTDETFGLVVFRAEDDDQAQAFMFADPSIKNNVMLAELHPLHISLIVK
jgi:uncharacterized protein YciI